MVENKFTILAIDDDQNILDTFQVILDGIESAVLYTASSFKLAEQIVNKIPVNLVLVDIVFPEEIDGYGITRQLRKKPNAREAYFIMMSADRYHLVDRIKAYNCGVQEFLSKPFDIKEVELILKSKIQYYKKLKEGEYDNMEVITSGKFLLDRKLKKLTIGNESMELTTLEFQMLLFFIKNAEVILDTDDITQGVWGSDANITSDNVRSAIRKLRTKIEADFKKPKYIVNSKGGGYIFYPSGDAPLY